MNSGFLQGLKASFSKRGDATAEVAAEQDINQLAWRLLELSGAASRVALAQKLLAVYAQLNDAAITSFFQSLARDFGPNTAKVNAAIEAFQQSATQQDAVALHDAAEPARQELIRRLNMAPGATAALLAMRTDLLARLKSHPELQVVDHDFNHLLSSWFNRGFLLLQRITWDSPASILDKISQYEAVHQINDLDDLRRRVSWPDRRCYAFFHPAMREEPLIFVEVALTDDIPNSIATVLASEREVSSAEAANTAVFYSISNCQKGLRGVTFGNLIIKQVVEDLAKEFPALQTFVTLSPVPTFCRWLDYKAEQGMEVAQRVQRVLASENWWQDEKITSALQHDVLPLAAEYFIQAKRPDGDPVDPVSRFHLGNGARLERLNWLADVSANGIQQSAGLMVNYLYSPEFIEQNHEAYANHQVVVAASTVKKELDRRQGTAA